MEIGPAVIPLITALIAAGLAARVGGSAVRRFTPAKALWALGLLMFAIAAAAEAYGAADGWGPASFRVYYLAGGCLSVGLLGAGSAWLVLPRDAALLLTGALIVGRDRPDRVGARRRPGVARRVRRASAARRRTTRSPATPSCGRSA